MSYELDQSLMGESYQQSNSLGGYIKLPFVAPVCYWKHGDSNSTPETLQYYGRWNCTVEEYDEAAHLANIAVPKDIETRAKRDSSGLPTSETYSVYAWRSLIFSVIGSRSRWFFNKKTQKNNSHVQVLAHLFSKSDGQIVPTVPVILSAKVNASSALEKSIERWLSYIDKFNSGIPSIYFYMGIGTFGKESKFTGSHGTSTLPELYIPENLTAETLPFVGNETAQKMAKLKSDAQEWLNDQDWLNDSSNPNSQTQPEKSDNFNDFNHVEEPPYDPFEGMDPF